MKRLLALIVIFSAATSVLAQEEDPKGLTATSRAYREYRLADTEPRYGLDKVEAMIEKIKKDSEDNQVMPAKEFNGLTLKEKFTYCMLHGEEFSQNCNMMPGILSEEKKIFAQFTSTGGGSLDLSDRQHRFLKKNRAAVVALLKATIEVRHRVGLNLKNAIVELNAVELIPAVESVYNRDRKDQDILTLLMLLMKDGKYRPFLKSATYKKLYGDPDSSYKAFIDATAGNEKLVLREATAFYKTRKT